MTKKTLILGSAYGRRYSNKEAMLKDWEEGKDFKMSNGPYCSIRDLESLKKTFSLIIVMQAGTHLHIVL